MWLIETSTFALHEFQSEPPAYAILSHTWGEDEVTFQNLKDLASQKDGVADATVKPGFDKVKKCCAQALEDGFKYVWVDTCAIDKRSSSELSEAINSMFRWYAEAHVCYAYLADVSTMGSSTSQNHSAACAAYPRPVWGFPSSRWFLRGWTLQELVAPMHVVFYDQDWIEFGTKTTLLDDLVEITGIPSRALMQPSSVHHFSVAERMSWASKRMTTRVEDQAYSLLGLFGVNMPLLYGEGTKAFTRLQLQILTQSDDHSIFAWTASGSPSWKSCSVLATSPAMFSSEHTGSISRYENKNQILPKHPIAITNMGISMALPILADSSGSFMAVLNCSTVDKRIAVHITGSPDSIQRYRCRSQELVYLDLKRFEFGPPKTVYMMTDVPDLPVDYGRTSIQLALGIPKENGWTAIYRCKSMPTPENPPGKVEYSQTLWRRNDTEAKDVMIKETLRPIAEDEWYSVSFIGPSGNAFTLLFGPRSGRIWTHGIVGSSVFQLHEVGLPTGIMNMIFVEDFRRFDDPPWSFFRDRISYTLQTSQTISIAVKLVNRPPEPLYRVEISQDGAAIPKASILS
jgi:hypothetical protein